MECPKCGRSVEVGAFICPGCDYILDASFLGDDITDDEREKRPAARAASRSFGKPRSDGQSASLPADSNQPDFGEDAMILGDVGDAAGEVSSFQTKDAGVSNREATQARFYIGGAVAQLMNPDAIPEMAPGQQQSMRMTPFERHVLGFVNGKRSVGRIQKKAAMEETEFKTALALLADKGFIKLKGYKKPKQSFEDTAPPKKSSSSSSSKNSGPVPPTRAPLEGERTMVASMEHIEALANLALPSKQRSREAASELAGREDFEAASGFRSARPTQQLTSTTAPSLSSEKKQRPPSRPPSRATPMVDQLADTPVEPRAVSRLPGSPLPGSPLAAAAKDDAADNNTRGRFASLQADEVGDPNVGAVDDAWAKADNASSVFADSGSVARPPRAPSLADEPAEEELPPEVLEADGFDDGEALTRGRQSLASKLKDPTGMGDSLLPAGQAEAGAPVNEAADEEIIVEEPDDADDAAASFDDDEDSLGPPRRIHDELTGPLPPTAVVEEEEEDDDDDEDSAGVLVDEPAAPTGVMPASRPMTLPSDALMPLPEIPPPPVFVLDVKPVAAPKIEPPKPLLPLPGQALQSPPPMTPMPPMPPMPPKPMALPGQALVAAGAPAPTSSGPPRPPTVARISAASSVPFELRKKAERIYEQALKDQAEGRTASALMNAKLATNFDPSVPAYKELFDSLGAAPKAKPKGPQARELVLFEQASEAEGRGDYERAAKLLEEAIGVNPKAAALYNRLGVVLSIRLKRHDEALAHLKRAIELEPGSIVYMNNFSKVTGLLESVLEKDPKARKGKKGDDENKVAIKKMRPLKF